jgi:hypothetical protein
MRNIVNDILAGTSTDEVIDELLEARKKKAKPRIQNAKRVAPGGPPILADLVALLFSRGKRGVSVEDVASTFNAAPRTTRKWRAQLKALRFADYRETVDPSDNLRMFLTPKYDD